jgi:rfaE bifunctional protein kinase chain/domain
MKKERIQEILEAIRKVKIAVYGDFCLDAYWIMDPRGSEISLETGLPAEAVKRHYYSPGGASNIAANLAALKPAKILAIGVIGDDLFGRELTAQLKDLMVDTRSLVIQRQEFDTYTFTKKYMEEEEAPRIDFGFYNTRSVETDNRILSCIKDALRNYDVLIFNQQVPGSITNASFISGVNNLFDEFADKIVLLDSRHYNDRFRNVYRKTNEIEIAWLNGITCNPGEYIPLKNIARYGEKIFRQYNKPVFVTCGERGMMAFDEIGIHEIKGIQFLKRLDAVGAGDTTLSALSLCLAARIAPAEAAEFANLAAAVTIQKLFTTGTASGEEILAQSVDPDYIYQPDLAADPELAEYLPGTQIEICENSITEKNGSIKHAVFDHDGTISTLRRGWEEVMEKTMITAITGDQHEKKTMRLMPKIRDRVRDYIEKSTGVQTMIQMEAIVDMVNEFDLASPDARLDSYGYKKLYNQALLDSMAERLERIRKNPVSAKEFIIHGAVEFLKELKQRGVILYLASGTDKEYVDREAFTLGYAGLFDGGIYGAMHDIHLFSKKMVIQNILQKNDLKSSELIIFGDGPVEVRESRKQGGLAIGVASDEEKMTGIDMHKRSRLIKAGAQAVIPDFQEYRLLLNLLFK